jgi:RNA polymerase sigma factor (sigma-70 family)
VDFLVRHLLAQPPLDADREQVLARAARAGDRVARAELLRGSLRLVALRARSLGLRGEALDEAVQSGTLGLIAAIDRFDPDRGCRLATYAWPWITAAIRTPVRVVVPVDASDVAVSESSDTSIDLGPMLAHLPLQVGAVVRLRYRLGESGGEPRTRREVAALLGLTVGQVRADEARAMTHLRRQLARVGHRAPREGADPL